MRIRRHSPTVYVISSDDPPSVRRFLDVLGSVFVDEELGAGPAHVFCARNGQVFEIDPQRGDALPPCRSQGGCHGNLQATLVGARSGRVAAVPRNQRGPGKCNPRLNLKRSWANYTPRSAPSASARCLRDAG